MSARGDARKRLAPPADDEHADILAELAETQAALHAATNDVVRLAAELHTAHGQIDRVRALVRAAEFLDSVSISTDFAGNPFRNTIPQVDILAALDGGAS